MANELTISGSMSFSKGGVTTSKSYTGKTVTVSGTKYTKIVQTIGTSEEALDLGDVGTPGYCIIENLDATNFVSIRRATGEGNFLKILGGKAVGPLMLAATAPYAIADTANVAIELTLVEA